MHLAGVPTLVKNYHVTVLSLCLSNITVEGVTLILCIRDPEFKHWHGELLS
jgi:hypothetical protein